MASDQAPPFPSRYLAALILFAAAPVLCGLYGALHDQLSYSISPEYFTQFKFDQFAIPRTLPDRVGAAVVGFLATWWVGIPIGLVLSGVALRLPDGRTMLRETAFAYLRVLLVAVVIGLVGLVVGNLTIPANPVRDGGFWVIPSDVQDRRAFLLVGTLHEASYLGGAIGFFWALVWMARRIPRIRIRAQLGQKNWPTEGVREVEYLLVLCDGATPEDVAANTGQVVEITYRNGASVDDVVGSLVSVALKSGFGSDADANTLTRAIHEEMGPAVRSILFRGPAFVGGVGFSERQCFTFSTPAFPLALAELAEMGPGDTGYLKADR